MEPRDPRRRRRSFEAPGTLVTAPSSPIADGSAPAAGAPPPSARTANRQWPVDQGDTLQPQDLAITILGAHGRSSEQRIWSGGMVRLLREFGFSTGAARVALGRLARSGLLIRVKHGRRVFYELTPQLEHLLEEGDRHIFGLGRSDEWSGDWTVVWQAVPDELGSQRRRLARRLRFLGFGPVQNATWVSPHDRAGEVATVVDDLRVGQYVGVIVGRPASDDALQTLVSRAWDLDGLGERYERFLKEVQAYRLHPRRERLEDRDAFLLRTRLVHRFRRFPSFDPGLPEGLLRRRWRRREAVEAFHELYDALGEPAQRHFDRAMSVDAPGERRRPRGAPA